MAKFKMNVTCDNAAFFESVAGDQLDEFNPAELARILREVADELEAGDGSGLLRDHNGNRVGSWELGDE